MASYLDARAQQGAWLLRIEDLDPPREQAGADQLIMNSLQAHGLRWDGEVLYQSSRLAAYEATLKELHRQQKIYRCTCTRAQLTENGGPYPGTCRHQNHPASAEYALRLTVNEAIIAFEDQFQGPIAEELANTCGDFIVRRKDGLISYQLAVSVDDAFQGVTHVIRGIDLLDSTCRQIHILQQLNQSIPEYGHIPVLLDSLGNKLSKQTGAPAILDARACENLCEALSYLNQPAPPRHARTSVDAILAHAIAHYRPAAWRLMQSITIIDSNN